MDSFLIIVLDMKFEMATKHNVEENSMRKTLLSALGLVLALSMCATIAFAAGPGRGRNFVDTDGDGICDNCGSYHWCGMAGTGQGSGYDRGCQGGRGNGFRGGRGR